jgi:hypothetical protein
MSICDVDWALRIQPRGEPSTKGSEPWKMWRNVAAQTFSAWLAVVLFLQTGCRQYIIRNHHTFQGLNAFVSVDLRPLRGSYHLITSV